MIAKSLKALFHKEKPDDDLVVVGWISGGLEPYYGKKSDVERLRKARGCPYDIDGPNCGDCLELTHGKTPCNREVVKQ